MPGARPGGLGHRTPPRGIHAVGDHPHGRVACGGGHPVRRHARHGVEGDAAARPAGEVPQRPEHAGRPVDDAVEGRRHGQSRGERHADQVGGERAHHAEVGVGDVERPGLEAAAHLRGCERVDREAARQRDRQPVHGDAVLAGGGVATALAVRPGGRREHLDLVPGAHQLSGEVAHLALDATEPRRVAVGEHGDLHEASACHARGWATMSPTIVAFHAHPDDEALLTAGTMARAAAEGHRVVLVLATDGGAGLAAAELRRDGGLGERRLEEARRSSAGTRGGPRRVARLRRQRQRWRARARPAGRHPVLPGPASRRPPSGSPPCCAPSGPTCCSPTTRTAATATATTCGCTRWRRGPPRSPAPPACSRPPCRATPSCGRSAPSGGSTASPTSSTRRRSSVPSRPGATSPTG